MSPATGLSIGLAVLAAISNAVSNVLQRTADRREPHRLELHVGLLLDLAHKPIWLAGIAASLCSFGLIAAALRNGPLALVQPLVVLELPLTLLIAGAAFHFRLHAREWGAMVLLTAGLASFVGFLGPRESAPRAPAGDWFVGLGLTVVISGALVL
ncbi:MAG: DMT family transporter, partial [Actinomycetota bacterium]